MKIWIVNHYATPPDYGSSIRHYCLAKELSKYGHEVIVIASSNHHLNRKFKQNSSKYVDVWQDEFIKFVLLPSPSYKDNGFKRLWNMLYFSWQVLQLPKYIDEQPNIEQPDIIVGSSVHPFAAWSAERIADYYRIPFCFEVRDLWPQTLIDMKSISYYHPLAIILRLLEKYLYKQASRVITLLPYAYEYISKFDIQPEKIKYLPNGIDLELFSDIPPPTNKSEKLTLMYLGSHRPANGLDTLIDAATELEKKNDSQTIHWRLIGDGNQKQRLQKKIKQLGLTNIYLEQSVTKKQVTQTIADADILIFHLLNLDVFQYGISPNKLFDYFASKRPIIFACNARNNPVAEANAGITVPPEDPQAMANAIRQLAALPLHERVEMGKRGRIYVEKYHSYSSLGQQLNALLVEIMMENVSS